MRQILRFGRARLDICPTALVPLVRAHDNNTPSSQATRDHSMGSIEAQLSGALEDTQDSLATALARVEALRIREKHLVQDNARLRVKLREAGVPEAASGSPRSSPSGSPRSIRSAGASVDLGVDGVCVAHSGSTADVTSLAQQHPVIIHTSSSKELPASVVTTPESLEIFERRARISAAEFVGMSSVSPSEKSGSGKSGLISYLFGKPKSKSKSKDSKTAQAPDASKSGISRNVPLVPVGGTPPPPQAESKFDKYLDRHSWNGEVRERGEGESAPQREPEEEEQKAGLWQVLWKDGGGNGKLRRIVFEAGAATQAFMHQHIESWSRGAQDAPPPNETPNSLSHGDAKGSAAPESSTKAQGEQGELVPPKHFIPDGMVPVLNGGSTVLTEDHLKCLTGAIPKRHRQAGWTLLYSTSKHGISLQTMYRRAANVAPSILIVRDTSGYTFGAYCSEAWRMAPRFYGTGETFVFQLEPHRIYYPWKKESKVRNDFFMYGSMESIGVGGTGHFAIWLDGELLDGHSGMSDTFGSPCLASEDEFKIMAVELWGLA
ncbi:hypothetical protein BSKO_01303 [Bryopsis sp. KO-2023]|nr:hypothetical protein BSKO_01303 [Bryopsis sp. KO-2023]